jgi:hypothetical protein
MYISLRFKTSQFLDFQNNISRNLVGILEEVISPPHYRHIQRTKKKTEDTVMCRPFTRQRRRNKRVPTATSSRATKEKLLETVFSTQSVLRNYITRTPAGSNNSTVALRDVGGDEKGNQCLGHNSVTLFLGDIDTGTWPSRLGVSNLRR